MPELRYYYVDMWITKGKKILVLAPMADLTDQPFCRICREVSMESCHSECNEESAPLNLGRSFAVAQDDKTRFVIFSEMVSSEAIVRGNIKTLKMCEFDPIEKPFVIQLFGSTPDTIAKAAKIVVDKYHPDGIDINMGCPVPKITGKNLAGAALMKDHDRAVEIIKELKEINSGVPISVKTRLGWGRDDEILEFAPKLEAAGADVISIHGRTKTQGYTGEANWARIAEVKKMLKIPVLANGDIKDAEDIKRCLEITGADGVMIGRGALGNPWIFRKSVIFTPQLSSLRKQGSCVVNLDPCFRRDDRTPPLEQLIKVVLRHAELHVAHYGEQYGLTTFRKHLLYYFRSSRIKGVMNLKKPRIQLAQVKDLAELKNILLTYYK